MSAILPIEADTRERIYNASQGQTAFSVPFPIQLSGDLDVAVKADGAENFVGLSDNDFSFVGIGSPAGGTVTLVVPVNLNDQVRVRGAAVMERAASVVRNGRFNSQAMDHDFARQLIISQELARAISEIEVAQAVAAGGDMVRATYDQNQNGKVDVAEVAEAAPWSGLTDVPTEFPPAAHNHTVAQISDFTAAADQRIVNAVGSVVQAFQAAQGTAAWQVGTSQIESVVSPEKIKAAILALAPGGGGGSGDMAKSVYDTDNDGKVNAAVDADQVPWAGIQNKPASFSPSAHGHTSTEISDFNTAADGRIALAVGNTLQAFDANTAKTDVAQTFAALQASGVETLIAAATMTPTGDKNLIVLPLDQNATIANMTTITVGATYVFKILQDATGGWAPSWGSAYEFSDGTAPTLSTAGNAVDIVSGISFDGTSIQMFSPGKAFS